MKVPLNWLKQYIKLPKSQKALTDQLTMAGHMLDKVEIINKQTIIDLELRGNRADCYSMLGIAREVSALFKTPVKNLPLYSKLKKVKSLDNYNFEIITPIVKRIMMTTINEIKLQESPNWLKDNLKAYGVESINNIVDLTNFVMLETGQPMHAFDSDKLGKNLVIRLAKNRETMTTFVGKKVILTKDDLVFSNKKFIVSIAGAIGEKEYSISNATKNILIEAANYDRANIRRTIHRHNLFTDAGIRHEKDLDPNLVSDGINRFLYLIEKNGWGKINNLVFDYYPRPVKPWRVTVNYDYFKTLAGIEIDTKIIKSILSRLNFKIIKIDTKSLTVVVPTYRTDVVMEEDLIEEILRIYGYDKIPNQILSLEIPKDITPEYIKQELNIKTQALAVGLTEVISSSFVKPVYANNNSVSLINAPSPENKFMRTTLLPNLLEHIEKIINERGEYAQLFEIGKIYLKEKNKYQEKRKLGIIYWDKEKGNYKNFKGIIDALITKLNISEIDYQISLCEPNKKIYFVEIDLDEVLGKTQKYFAKLWPKYPPQIEDLTFVFPGQVRIGDITNSIYNLQSIIYKVEYRDRFEDAYTFRIYYQDPEKTLTNKEVEEIRNKIINLVSTKFGGTIKA